MSARKDNLKLLADFEPVVAEYAQRLEGDVDHRQNLDARQSGLTELRDRLNLVNDVLAEIRRFTAMVDGPSGGE